MKNIKNIAIVLAGAIAMTSCQKAGNTNVVVQTANNTASATPPANNASPAAEPPADSPATAAGSPTEIYKAAHTARQKKDIVTLKKLFSKDILDFFSEVGKADKKSLDDMLRQMCEDSIPGEPQVRNEKINGDKATVEYKDEKGSWKTMDFVKEGRSWKMTIPKGDPDKDKDDKDNK